MLSTNDIAIVYETLLNSFPHERSGKDSNKYSTQKCIVFN